MTETALDPTADIGLLAALLNVPQTLTGFNRVLEQFTYVWRLYQEIAEPSQRRKVEVITDTIEKIRRGELDLRKYKEIDKIPPAADVAEAVRRGQYRKTMKGHYGSRPLYCVFWHECASRAYEPQYRAMLASMLPALVELEQAKADDERLWALASEVGLALRQLTLKDISTTERTLLSSLPLRALPPKDLLDTIAGELARLGIEHAAIYGDRIHAIIRTLTWHRNGALTRGGLFQRRALTHGRAAPRHGSTAKQEENFIEERTASLSDGANIPFTMFRAEASEDSSDLARHPGIDPPNDAADRGLVVQIQTPPSTLRHRKDRAIAAATRARFVAQAIEMEAQHLPVTRSTLTGWDLKQLLRVIDEIDAPEWCETPPEQRAPIAAWMAIMFYLSRDEEAIENLQINAKGEQETIVVRLAEEMVWLPTRAPLHTPVTDGADCLIPTGVGFWVSAPRRLLASLRPLKTRYRRPFDTSLAPDAARILARINAAHGTNLTIARVVRHLADQLRQLAPNDATYGIYFRGVPPNQHNPAVYSAVPTERLVELYRQVVFHAEALAGDTAREVTTSALPTLLADDAESIGSRYVPRLAAARRAIESAYRRVNTLRGAAQTIEQKHNAYVALIALVAMVLTGIRGTRGALGLRVDIDDKTGVAFVSEKDDEQYTNARLVWILPALRHLFDEYSRHEFRVRQYLALRNPAAVNLLDQRDGTSLLSSRFAPSRTADQRAIDTSISYLYFLGVNGAPQAVTRSLLRSHLDGQWPLHLGVLRHFVRTQLLRQCVSGEIIDAQMGHYERGQNAWSRFSTLPPAAWRAALQGPLERIARDLGIRHVNSPLFP